MTLSIGIGLNAATYLQNYEYSRIAIEMALGRGGDQVVIKNWDKITYYGGKASRWRRHPCQGACQGTGAERVHEHQGRVVVMGHKITDVMLWALPSVFTVQVRHLANRYTLCE